VRGAILWTLFLVLAACASTKTTGPYQPASELSRDTTRAERLNREAAALMGEDPGRAEELLREALTCDLFFGPAHNNLGVLFLKLDKLYEAASEFEWARKLLPGHPDPRVNLALTMEKAGKTDDALAAYDAALEVYPGYLPAIMGAASLSLRTGREEARLREWLEAISLRARETRWREWSRGQLASL